MTGVASTTPDTTAPVITLTGANPQTITVGSVYTELGARAEDNVDGDVSTNITMDASAVDITTVGSYIVTYNVSDSAENSATKITRTINITTAVVIDNPANSSNGGGALGWWAVVFLLSFQRQISLTRWLSKLNSTTTY
ncbi:MAG: DUF5011 domain-containing protein [Gammaproteobacteria bacterium]|nr:DUF5011 domain-containing protein [Gammaproteobacteria bacterium]